ncbi:MAG: PTS fructose transporter subunit IIA, partial [Halothiobacillus sp. 13-55-115]
MTVGILLICHNHIGAQLLETATDMMEVAPIPAGNLSVLQDDDPIELLSRARK